MIGGETVRRGVLLLANPTAGGKIGSGEPLDPDEARLEPEALAGALRSRGLTVELHVLSEADDVGALARAAADDGRTVVVAGGDGTVAVAAVALLGRPDAALGVLATGSFNNIAHGFGVPTTLDAALDAIATAAPEPVDSGMVEAAGTQRPFFEAVGVGIETLGFLALAAADRRGWLAAAKILWRARRLRGRRLIVTVDGETHRARSMAVSVSNGPYHGPGLAVSPDADPGDGLLDVAIITGMGRLELLRHLLAVTRRQPRFEPRVERLRGRSVRIEGVRAQLPAHADGESIGATPLTARIQPGALRLLRPPVRD